MDSLQLLTLYLTLTPIFSGRKARINLHSRPKLTVVIPISCLLPGADQEIFVGGGGGGGDVNLTKKSSDSVVCLFLLFSKSSAYFTGVKWLISKKNIIFQDSGGGPIFSRGWSNFFQGRGGGGPIAYSL